ncbi:adhesion G-protein coupled receptor G5 [Myotis lucifugus]|uniref:adhesion G-protein coupled receptor G5 n=1 Tax=Myotis lucifugus TaxID=59463 RepID=UPI0003C45FE2|nr:adhesion G-protein coupled receptor G5 [Myotis lucifugus]
MDCRAVLFLCLSLVTCQNGEEENGEGAQETNLNGSCRDLVTSLALRLVHGLVYSLLNATFQGSNQTWQTSTIQTLAFKLGCDFAGLSLYSDALGSPPSSGGPAAGARHAMQFPTELTKKACRTRRRELRLICMYFFTTRFFPHDNSSLLNDYVLGAQLGSEHVDNLMEPINISFWHNQSLEGYNVTCVFWKEGASKHHWGLWSPEGCRTEQPSPSQVLCRCNHLSYFAVLMVWVPALLVLLLLAIKSSAYGRHTISLSHSQGNSTGLQHVSICWVQSPVVHHVLVMGYGGLTTLFNLVVLAWALRTLRRLKAREEAPGSRACRDTVTVLGLTVLLGTTWALAFFSFGIFLLPQLFLFTIFNSLYGFFLFLWFCSQRCRAEAEAEAEKEAFSSSQMMH